VEEPAGKRYVPERPMPPREPERPTAETVSDKMKKLFRRRRGGL